jgi:adenine-specific DNA-methyltransferase
LELTSTVIAKKQKIIAQTIDTVQLQNRRYIGNKYKLVNWIFSIINKECEGYSFADLFAGTGVVSAEATRCFANVIINDFLYSNQVIYQAVFGNKYWDKEKVIAIMNWYNSLCADDLTDNYFSKNFGGKYFSNGSAKIIGFIREHLEANKRKLRSKEYYIILASLLYAADKIANTVGHFDAYFKKRNISDQFSMKLLAPRKSSQMSIYQEDANYLVGQITADVVYIDPPYNSRQYSRFYHVLETLTKWDKPKLYGVALKPEPENMSEYCRNNAKIKFQELICNLKAKYIVVSYNNTYESKSNSSKNKILLEEIKQVLQDKGNTKIFEKDYKYFNAGNTCFDNHKEYLFVTKTTR